MIIFHNWPMTKEYKIQFIFFVRMLSLSYRYDASGKCKLIQLKLLASDFLNSTTEIINPAAFQALPPP